MIFKIKESEDNWINEIYESSMAKLDEFFNIGWKRNRPSIILLSSRKQIDALASSKTEDWLVGWSRHDLIVYMLDPENYESESNHKFSKGEYTRLMIHELGHCFLRVISNGRHFPNWLNEGLCIYLSGQLKLKNKPEKLTDFLDFFTRYDYGVYKESGFAVKFLIENYGKEKIIELIKRAKEYSYSEENFKKLFEEIYGFELNYNNFKIE